jgi:hypothetical protein
VYESGAGTWRTGHISVARDGFEQGCNAYCQAPDPSHQHHLKLQHQQLERLERVQRRRWRRRQEEGFDLQGNTDGREGDADQGQGQGQDEDEEGDEDDNGAGENTPASSSSSPLSSKRHTEMAGCMPAEVEVGMGVLPTYEKLLVHDYAPATRVIANTLSRAHTSNVCYDPENPY